MVRLRRPDYARRALDQFGRRSRARDPCARGIASSRSGTDGIAVFLEDGVYPRGAVLLGIAGEIEVHALVAQGAEPIGQPWTLTDCESNLVKTIGARPAVDVLRDTLDQLDDETRERAQRNLLVGLAMDEYRDEYGRGDYLIRNVLGFERESGAIAISVVPRIGQTIQFQFRDAAAADDDLRHKLAAFRAELAPEQAHGNAGRRRTSTPAPEDSSAPDPVPVHTPTVEHLC